MKKVNTIVLTLILLLTFSFFGEFNQSQQSKVFAATNSFESFDNKTRREISRDAKILSTASLEEELDDSSVL